MTKWNVQDPPEKEEREIHPEGTFDAIVIGAKADKTKTGKDMLVLDLKTGRGEVRAWLTHNVGTRYEWIFFKELEALGVGKDFFEDDPSHDDVAIACLKARVLIDVSHEDFEGKTHARVRRISPVIPEAF